MRNWFQNKVPKLSIPIKVIVVGGAVYTALLLLSTGAVRYFGLDLQTIYFGFSLKTLLTFGPIFLGLLGLCLASYFFFERPFTKLAQTITKAAEGDFLIRAPQLGGSEVGGLATKFNQMLVKLTDLSARKIQADYDLIIAQEELKYKKRLEEKGCLVERANRQLENLVRDLSLLYDIGQTINQTIEIHQLYDLITEVLRKYLKLENFSLMVWDEKRRVLQIKSAFGFENMDPLKEMTFEAGEGIAGEVLKTGKMIYVEDVTENVRFAEKEIDVRGSVLSVPLAYKGSVIGVVNFGRERPHAFGPHDMKMLTLAANQIALAMANAKLYTQTRELSVTDELTQVFNRRHFGQIMQLEWKRAARFKRELSLLMIDVDYFKRYNDTCGHLKGDEALRKIGKLLNTHLREVDTVARFGGEEFVVLLPDTDKRGALAVAEKLRHLVQEDIPGVTISVGIANHPEDVLEMDDLIDHADIALYQAKDYGRNRVVPYHPAVPQEPVLKSSEEGKEKEAPKTRLVH